jgi:hypothetical protein
MVYKLSIRVIIIVILAIFKIYQEIQRIFRLFLSLIRFINFYTLMQIYSFYRVWERKLLTNWWNLIPIEFILQSSSDVHAKNDDYRW